jgi:shikimate dehydrogenase
LGLHYGLAMAAKRYALVGENIDNSLSPKLMNAAFKARGIDAEYVLRPTLPEDLDEVIDELRTGEWAGLNITRPYKCDFFTLVDMPLENASRAKAVNTLWLRHGQTHGALTDVQGVIEPLIRAGFGGGGEGLILGAGGAARAAALALSKMGTKVHVAARRIEQAQELFKDLLLVKTGEVLDLNDAQQIEKLLPQIDGLIQATPLGMQGEAHVFDFGPIKPSCIAFEMVYAPAETSFIKSAQEKGLRCVKGLEMLEEQGEAALGLWVG